MEFTIQTSKSQEMIDITDNVNEAIKNSNAKEGLCSICISHTSGALIINENADPDICTDILNALNKVFPDRDGYLHDKIDNNAGAHIKAAVLGTSETVPIKNGKLKLGTWQSVIFVELDGPRKRKINVTIINSES